jgi:putative ABC transport system ATP-binding protein
VLADEPTGALDSVGGDTILALLRDRCDAGAAALVVTHDSRLAGWADRIVNLRDGALVAESVVH